MRGADNKDQHHRDLHKNDDVIEVWKAQMIISKANTQQRWDVTQLANRVTNLQEQVSTLKKKMN